MNEVQGYAFDIKAHASHLVAGAFVGIFAFAVLLLVLVPVLAHRREASVPKGILSVVVSSVVLTLGIVVIAVFQREALLVFLTGELVGFFAGWVALAVAVLVRR